MTGHCRVKCSIPFSLKALVFLNHSSTCAFILTFLVVILILFRIRHGFTTYNHSLRHHAASVLLTFVPLKAISAIGHLLIDRGWRKEGFKNRLSYIKLFLSLDFSKKCLLKETQCFDIWFRISYLMFFSTS